MDRGDPERFGPYTVIRKLGEGGMGAVFEVRHDTIGRRAAIKVLHSEYAQATDASVRFINEARSVSRIDHPGLIQIYDFVKRDDGLSYIVMEYLQGETISTRLRRATAGLDVQDVIRLGWQIADCLAAAHSKGVIHRDLKPSNVMIVFDPYMQSGERTKVLDFGLAKIVDAANGANTSSSVIMGTPLYMSPEQCNGANRVDALSDVYSLGCMLYEMLCGRPPFIGDTAAQILGMHLFNKPIPISEKCKYAPAPLCHVIDLALEKDKSRRPTMKDVANELKRIDSTSRNERDSSATLVPLSAPFRRSRIKQFSKYALYLLLLTVPVWIDRQFNRDPTVSNRPSSSVMETIDRRIRTTTAQSVPQSTIPTNSSSIQPSRPTGVPLGTGTTTVPGTPATVSTASTASTASTSPADNTPDNALTTETMPSHQNRDLHKGIASPTEQAVSPSGKKVTSKGKRITRIVKKHREVPEQEVDELFQPLERIPSVDNHATKEPATEAKLPESTQAPSSVIDKQPPAPTVHPGKIQVVD